jgi:hypothetical protein
MTETKTRKPRRMVRDAIIRTIALDIANAANEVIATPISSTPSHPAVRPQSKTSLMLELLNRSEGATLDHLIAATGWLPHTARAALTGLRQKGHAIASEKNGDGARTYRIAAPEPEAAA